MLDKICNGLLLFLGVLLVGFALLLGAAICCGIAADRPAYEWAELRLPCGEVVAGEVQELTISGEHAAVVIDGVGYLVSLDDIIFVNRP